MEHLAKLFVSVIELAESELESLKSGVIRLGLSLILLIVAGVTGLIGVILFLTAGFLLLELLLNRPAAFAISGGLFLAVTAGLVVIALRHSQTAKLPAPAAEAPTTEHLPTDPSHDQVPPIRIAS